MSYPTNEDRQSIRDFIGTPKEFLEHIDSLWEYDGFTVTDGKGSLDEDVKVCELSTWGWSGNEDLIGVMRETYFWLLYWYKSQRGGHYTFEIPTDHFEKSIIKGRYGIQAFEEKAE